MGRTPSREFGFSLIESAVVASVAVVLITIGVFNVRQALAREEIDGWVRSIVYDVRAGQQAAITRRASVTASFQDQNFTVAVSGGGTLRQQTLPTHITFGSTLMVVTFDRRGTPLTGISLTVSSATARRSYTIAVAAGTGLVSYSEP